MSENQTQSKPEDDEEPREELDETICSACRHYVPYVNGKGEFIYGECHRNPPTSQRVPSMQRREMFPAVFEWVTNWPRVDQEDSCGCFDLLPNNSDHRRARAGAMAREKTPPKEGREKRAGQITKRR